jgi:hypothetical protein
MGVREPAAKPGGGPRPDGRENAAVRRALAGDSGKIAGRAFNASLFGPNSDYALRSLRQPHLYWLRCQIQVARSGPGIHGRCA